MCFPKNKEVGFHGGQCQISLPLLMFNLNECIFFSINGASFFLLLDIILNDFFPL